MPKTVTKEMLTGWLRDAEHRCPRLADPARWRVFLDDVRRFAAGGWLEKCERLEWTDYDLFACDKVFALDNPATARTGLLPALNGRELSGLHIDYAVIRITADQNLLHPKHLLGFSRHHAMQHLVLIWDIAPAAVAAA